MPSSLPSLSPTGSYCIIVTIVYDAYPTRTSWELYSIGLDGIGVEVKSYSEANEDATSHTETVCLTEREYDFVIYDIYGEYGGICCDDGEGHYNVTTFDGKVIAEGGDFGGSEVTRFSIPFVPAPSISPSRSISPTIIISNH